MLDACGYLYKTLKQEIIDELTTFRDITQFYFQQVNERITFKKKLKQIKKKLKNAKCYQQWSALANEHDSLPQIQESLNSVYSPYYDYKYIEELKSELKKARLQGQTPKLIAILRSHSNRNVGNINSRALYQDGYNSTKKLIEEFQLEVEVCLRAIMNADLPNLKKLQFFGELRHSVGRSALLLSGGAILGMHHIGVVQTLMEADCMPKIIAGSSAGSLVASIVATRKKEDFMDGSKINFVSFANKKRLSLWTLLKRFAKSGFLLDNTALKNFLKDNLGEITFQEVFDRFGYILNITVTGNNQYDEDRLLNYLTAPNVMVWSAVSASCALPLVYGATDLICKDANGEAKPYTLMNRKFLDGSIAHDLPMNKLSVFFNVNNFIVSQTNPWVIPFMDITDEFKSTSNPFIIKILLLFERIKSFLASEIKHRVAQMALIFPGAITKFFNLATQDYMGNITIWPLPSVSKYLRILQNPSDWERIKIFVEDGRFRTYPKISQIKSSLFYENQISKCLKHVKKASFLVNSFIKKDGDSVKDLSEFEETQYIMKNELEQVGEGWDKKKCRNQSFMIPRGNSYV